MCCCLRARFLQNAYWLLLRTENHFPHRTKENTLISVQCKTSIHRKAIDFHRKINIVLFNMWAANGEGGGELKCVKSILQYFSPLSNVLLRRNLLYGSPPLHKFIFIQRYPKDTHTMPGVIIRMGSLCIKCRQRDRSSDIHLSEKLGKLAIFLIAPQANFAEEFSWQMWLFKIFTHAHEKWENSMENVHKIIIKKATRLRCLYSYFTVFFVCKQISGIKNLYFRFNSIASCAPLYSQKKRQVVNFISIYLWLLFFVQCVIRNVNHAHCDMSWENSFTKKIAIAFSFFIVAVFWFSQHITNHMYYTYIQNEYRFSFDFILQISRMAPKTNMIYDITGWRFNLSIYIYVFLNRLYAIYWYVKA